MVDRMNCLRNNILSSRQNSFQNVSPYGLDRTRQFLSQLPSASANHSACSELSLFKPRSYHFSSFASNWQSIAEEECHPCSSSLFCSRIRYTQIYAQLSVPCVQWHFLAWPWVLLMIPCWREFIAFAKVNNKKWDFLIETTVFKRLIRKTIRWPIAKLLCICIISF
jgi:hypothetical protein